MRVKMLIMGLAVLTLAGCGPDGTTPPPPAGQVAPQWVTFWARAYSHDTTEIYTQNVGYVVSAYDANMDPVILGEDGHVNVDVEAITTPAYWSFQPDPQVDRITFSVSAAMSAGYTLTCEVRAGDQHQPDAPLISGDSALSRPVGAMPMDIVHVTCAYPEL